MSGLRELQRDFHCAVTRGESGMPARLVSTARADAAARLTIYADAYRKRLLDVLESDYPGLQALLGAEEFAILAHAYIAAWPSRQPSVRWFGGSLSRFLHDNPRYAQRPLLAELAAFEWTQGLVFDAADAAAVSIEAVASIPAEDWAGLRLRLHPSVRRLKLACNAPAVWRALDRQAAPPTDDQDADARCWLLWRADYDIHWRSLEADEAAAFDAVQSELTFGEICEQLCQWHAAEQAPLRAASLLKRWVSDALVTAVQVPSSPAC